MPGPDHRRPGRTHRRGRPNYPFDLGVGDVAEDAAEQQHVSRQRVSVAGDLAGVRLSDLNLSKTGFLGAAPSLAGVGRIELHQQRTNVVAPPVTWQYSGDVVALAGRTG